MNVAIRELKSDLSRILARAQAGEEFEVTSHNRPVARIIGIPPQAKDGVRRLMANGALDWNGGKPEFGAPLSTQPEGTPVSLMVLEDRQ
ncbi:MAG: type II toxin-antitoxin system prevent-host-death family antitoxin [Betaproteobacteria bacterium]|nr:type II toxin-antitoxin system prevent-host-death family antitoxin [Betaproteobacteria bacterium]